VLISILLDRYVYQGVVVLTSPLTNIRLAHFIQWGWLVITNGVLVLFLYLLFRVFPKKRSHPLFNGTLNLFLTLFVTRLVFAVFLLGEDIYRLLLAAIHLLTDSRPLVASRSIWVSSVAAIMSIVPFVAF